MLVGVAWSQPCPAHHPDDVDGTVLPGERRGSRGFKARLKFTGALTHREVDEIWEERISFLLQRTLARSLGLPLPRYTLGQGPVAGDEMLL